MKKYIILTSLLLFLTGLTTLLFFFSPTEIIEAIGIKNGYLVIFIFAFFGGVSGFTSVSFYATVITFALGGLHPAILALVAGPGLFVGDTVFYYLGTTMHNVLSEKIQRRVARLTKFIYKPKVYRLSPAIIYCYVGVSPFPPDILILGLSISGYPYKKLIVPLLLGEMTFVIFVSTLALYGVRIFGL